MPARQAFPHIWLLTDERQGEALFPSLRRLPPGSGVIFRHKSLKPADRRALFERAFRIAQQRGLLLLLAGDDALARRWRADGSHHRCPGPPRFGTAPAHDIGEIRAAERSGAMAILLSPIHPTRSHPGAPALGRMRFAALARATRLPVIALGGVDPKRGAMAMAIGAYGWAAIDAWL